VQACDSDAFFSELPLTPAATLLATLIAQGKTLTCAESCTGGLVSSLLTEIPGASRAFHAGFITYSNAMKTAMLGVQASTLAQHGAVSEQTVREMALGALQRSGADYAIALSGIAGPDGGTAEKPVGTVWIAWGSQQQLQAHCFRLGETRKHCQQRAAAIALDLIHRTVIGETQDPPYFLQDH
jgi:nicotinamide-nucleotide amidase